MEKKIARIGNLILESGKVKIAIPVMGDREEDVLSQAALVIKEKPDLVEWRADMFLGKSGSRDAGAVIETGKKLKAFLEGIPLLFTIRTKDEGGNADVTVRAYEEIIKNVVSEGLADAVDLEIFKFKEQEDRLSLLVNEVKRHGAAVVMSNHDFNGTPEAKEIVKRLKEMEKAGADVAKIAVMPRDRQDVMNLMNASFEADKIVDIPLIAMSMGELGRISRLSGDITGSCVTFAAAGRASAPGQISVEKLRGILAERAD